MNDPIESLRRQLQQLKQQHDSGALDTTRYDESRAPLERQLVDAVTSDALAAPPSEPRPSRSLLAGLTAAVLREGRGSLGGAVSASLVTTSTS